MIIESTLSKDNSVTRQDVIGLNVSEIICENDLSAYLLRLNRCLKKGVEYCTFKIQDHLFLARMERIKGERIRVVEYEITRMKLEKAVSLFVE